MGMTNQERKLFYFYKVPKGTQITRSTEILGVWATNPEEGEKRIKDQSLGILSDMYDCVYMPDGNVEDETFLVGVLF